MYPYISLSGLRIPSYGLCMTVAVFLCVFLAIRKARKSGIFIEDVLILSAVTVGSFLLGGGLLYILVSYSPTEICVYIKKLDFSFITNGGLVFFGGLISGILGGIICAKLLKIDIEKLEACTVPYIPLGHAIGRIGCLLAGCCHGFEYDGIFAVRNVLISDINTYFPVQGLEAILNVMIAAFLLIYIKKEHRKYDVLTCYLMIYSVIRFFLEIFRGDEIRGAFLQVSTSQWVSLILFAVCFALKRLRCAGGKPKKRSC